ncbi:penicillin-binding protein 2, partial [Ralstonia pseudosolanacearum]
VTGVIALAGAGLDHAARFVVAVAHVCLVGVAPALREAGTSAQAVAPATLDAQVLQALSHVQPAPDLPSPRGRNLPAAPASAPAASPKDRKPAVKPNPKPAPKPARAAP